MELAIFSPVFGQMQLEEMLQFLQEHGIKNMEMGAGGHPGMAHINPELLLNDEAEYQRVMELFAKYEVEIKALSCHGNPVSPNVEEGKTFHQQYVNTCKLAKKMGVKTVVTFSGCPGGSPEDKTPNWITCTWPSEFGQALDYQWNEVLIPYWKEAIKVAEENDVNIAIELHPGFCAYNPSTVQKLRDAVGSPRLGVNFDPSHLFWQQIDPVEAIVQMKGYIYHVHAKDTYINEANTKKNGVLDTIHRDDIANNSWHFRTVGYGQSLLTWRNIISALQLVGYEGVISIEHEDGLMSVKEGLEKGIDNINSILIKEQPTGPWWL
ncbi:MAG: sugar phosphate isomerase/epimerase family protein [Mycoplasmatales bacterium]